ncbi:spore germination protein [Natronincola peptidivorans]|uniref:Spore germination protein n=1 Tax=Natronincola peptidivorans TaxID=426128 RepID=A0A1I0EAP7_9FIRM|nr:spore germination protein [Natronincola peptidivorans]SET42278.1 spore germination protein [Natronincola peptidivorans]
MKPPKKPIKKPKKIININENTIQPVEEPGNTTEVYLNESLERNLEYLQFTLKHSQDIIYKKILVGQRSTRMTIIYVDGMINEEIVNNQVLKSLMRERFLYSKEEEIVTVLEEKILTVSDIEKTDNFETVIHALLTGDTLLLVEGSKEALIINSKGVEAREVEEANTEQTLRGPRESFIEGLKGNISLIRKRIRDQNLSVEFYQLGKTTATDVAVVYLRGTAESTIVDEIKNRIKKIKVDRITSSANVEQLIENYKWTIFPQMLATERPDKVVGSILEGRVAIIVDGTPFVLVAPATFAMFLNSADDYFERAIITSFIRMMRYISYFFATTLPGLYIALTAYHPGMLPTPLVLYITGTRVGLPFPFLVEILFMEFTLEALLEASVRLPKPVGQTIGIVGGLVIGQAVVQAGLVSPIVVIIVALTAITSFVLPNYTFSLTNRFLRLYFIVGGAVWGLYGIVTFWIIVVIHLASIDSFSVRYLADFSPYRLGNLKDTLFKAPVWLMEEIPPSLKEEKEDTENEGE